MIKTKVEQRTTKENIDQNTVDIAVIIEKIKKIDDMEETLATIQKDVAALTNITNKWQGGLFVILFLGGMVGGLATFIAQVWKYFHGY